LGYQMSIKMASKRHRQGIQMASEVVNKWSRSGSDQNSPKSRELAALVRGWAWQNSPKSRNC
jgi:hypothetical protein